MKSRRSGVEQRAARRVAVSFRAKLRVAGGLTFYGECSDLSVGGMTLRTSYVPRPQEEFEVYLLPPRAPGGGAVRPLCARVRVVRCHELERGQLYELGLATVEVLE